MQYTVIPAKLRDCACELENTAQAQQRVEDELLQIRTRLSRLSGMEGVTGRINGTREELERLRGQTRSMARGARRIAELYERTERAVADAPDRTVYRIKAASSTAAAAAVSAANAGMTAGQAGRAIRFTKSVNVSAFTRQLVLLGIHLG